MKFFKIIYFLLAVIGAISIYNFYYQNNQDNEYPVEKSAKAEKPKKEASANAPKLKSGEKKNKNLFS